MRPRKSVPRCPKCKGIRLLLIEICEHSGSIEQNEEGLLVGMNGVNCMDLVFEPGAVVRVMATCQNCDYFWKVPRMIQITDHPNHNWNRA